MTGIDVGPMADFFQLPHSLIAEALTIQELEIFLEIPMFEILSKIGWTPRHDDHPHIAKMIKRFHDVSLWIATNIVKKETREERAQMIQTFLSIAEVILI